MYIYIYILCVSVFFDDFSRCAHVSVAMRATCVAIHFAYVPIVKRFCVYKSTYTHARSSCVHINIYIYISV